MAISRSLGGTSLTTRSPIKISPAEISSRPAIRRRVVDLPQPEGPTSTRNSLSRTSRLTSLTDKEFLVLVGPLPRRQVGQKPPHLRFPRPHHAVAARLQPFHETPPPHPVSLLRPPFIMTPPQLPDQTLFPHRPAGVPGRQRRLLLPRTAGGRRVPFFPLSAFVGRMGRGVRGEVFRVQDSAVGVRCSAFSSVCQVAPRHVEKPVQRPLRHRQLRFPQPPPPPLHLADEQPRRSHRRPLPRPLAKTEIFHDGQTI